MTNTPSRTARREALRPTNVLFVVWDACRLDVAREHAPTLAALADSNLEFENAIAPAGYSLPSHVSLFTGEYPHEHGTYEHGQSVGRLSLLDELGERGYTRYGVSANGFASPMYGFDRDFDRFYNTQAQMVYPEGLDVHGYVRRRRESDDGTDDGFDLGDIGPVQLLRETLSHPRPAKSLANVGAAALTEAVRRSPLLQRVPHPRFSTYSEFSYAPAHNTRTIESILAREARGRNPFFVFTNYMDAHHPYAPPKRYQREMLGRTLSFSELARLADRTHPHEFIRRVERGERPLGERDLETVRALYAGEVRTADDHLARLLAALDEHGLREDTLVVVTADHGENLGETDGMGTTRMGHSLSVSDHLLRVPLVIAHPALAGRRVEEYVSLTGLRALFTDGLQSLLESGGTDLGGLLPEAGVVSSQLPASSNDALPERYPTLRELFGQHRAMSYTDGWKVLATSVGEERAWHEGIEVEFDDAPAACRAACRDALAGLESPGDARELATADRSHLEALGYL